MIKSLTKIHQKSLGRYSRSFSLYERTTNISPSKYCTAGGRIVTRYNHQTPNKSFIERIRHLRSNGTPEIVIGTTLLLLAITDYTLQQRNTESKQETMRQLQRMVDNDAKQLHKEVDKTQQPLFQCVVRRVPHSLDGHACLTNVHVGDVLNVLEEGVGPGKVYNLCEVERSGGVKSVGWFPCSCLEPIKD
jgi:hypothetical protein